MEESSTPQATNQITQTARVGPRWFVLPGVVLLIIMLAVVALFVAAGWDEQETDDAYIEAHIVSVIPKVSAYVNVLHIDDNSRVAVGDLLVELDPRDYINQVAVVRADLAVAEGRVKEASSQIVVTDTELTREAAELKVAMANAKLAAENLVRVHAVSDVRAVSAQRVDEAQAAADGAHAALAAAQIKVQVAQAQAQLVRTHYATASASVEQVRALLAQALLNLSYTKIYATQAGTVANKNVEAGNFVEPGQALLSIVPDTLYVIANYKETQLARVRPGQHCVVTVDALPGVRLQGHVDSIQRGTGSRFALLPPENATGNFVKVVQRVPVKITLDNREQGAQLITPGMSVETRIDVEERPTWLRFLN